MTDPRWPDLHISDLAATLDTLHLWTQIVGKVKVETLPWLNESWHVPLYVSSQGLTSGLITHGREAFELSFDFVASKLRLATSTGRTDALDLREQSVADFHGATLAMLDKAGLPISISQLPCEIAGAVPFAEDHVTRLFDPTAARAYWLILVQVHRVFHRFRSRYVGKCSPIHFFWGSFDLAVTRFSGRTAPMATHGAPNVSIAVMEDAYAGEQASFGFWPGGTSGVGEPSFYVEAWPAPDRFARAAVAPAAARFVEDLGEWVLSYSDVRNSASPDETLLAFLQSGYEAIADASGWDRRRLEREEGPIGHPPRR